MGHAISLCISLLCFIERAVGLKKQCSSHLACYCMVLFCFLLFGIAKTFRLLFVRVARGPLSGLIVTSYPAKQIQESKLCPLSTTSATLRTRPNHFSRAPLPCGWCTSLCMYRLRQTTHALAIQQPTNKRSHLARCNHRHRPLQET